MICFACYADSQVMYVACVKDPGKGVYLFSGKHWKGTFFLSPVHLVHSPPHFPINFMPTFFVVGLQPWYKPEAVAELYRL